MARLSWSPSPDWLLELQARFGQVLRTPLDRSSGALSAHPASYDRALVQQTKASARLAAAERLAIYNRQYWFRLFTVTQRAFPLLARLLGYWEFNRWAALYVETRPPSGWDIDNIVAPFESFLSALLPGAELDPVAGRGDLPAGAVREAAALDAAHHRVFRAPAEPPYTPSASDAERLLDGKLRLRRAAAIVIENWPLCELRSNVVAAAGGGVAVLPARLPAPQAWLLVRDGLAIRCVPLQLREAELLQLLSEHSVSDALGQLEAGCAPAERAELPEQARGWLARSMRLGLWTGLK